MVKLLGLSHLVQFPVMLEKGHVVKTLIAMVVVVVSFTVYCCQLFFDIYSSYPFQFAQTFISIQMTAVHIVMKIINHVAATPGVAVQAVRDSGIAVLVIRIVHQVLLANGLSQELMISFVIPCRG